MPGLLLITAPTVEPITLVEARDHLRLDATGSPLTHPDDTILTNLILAARLHLDGRDGKLYRALLTQTWDLSLDRFPDNEIRIPFPPLQSITHIKYDDVNGVEATVSSADYVVDTVSRVGWVLPVTTTTWPTTFDSINAVRVRFKAGYGDAAVDVPQPIKSAMLLMIAHWYENKEAVTIGQPGSILPMGVEALLSPYEIISFA